MHLMPPPHEIDRARASHVQRVSPRSVNESVRPVSAPPPPAFAAKLYLDIETRSEIDLRKVGQYAYAEHPTTEIIVICWALDDAPVETWFPLTEPEPFELRMTLDDPTIQLVAHNASFERTLLSYGPRARYPHMRDLGRWDCTAGRAASYCLPRTLEGAAYALALPVQKDAEGHRLMLTMCKPLPMNRRRGGERYWLEDAESMARLAAYCVRDVDVERAVDRALPAFTAFERRVWELTERMNDRGVGVDDVLMAAAINLVERAEAHVNDRLSRATNGRVAKVTNHGAITLWLQGLDLDDDFASDGVGKAALAAMLERDDLPDIVREVLIMRQENGKSSAAKYVAILRRLSHDGRIRGVMVYCGAASTGRWSSRGAQLHNLIRSALLKKLSVVEAVLADLQSGADLDDITAAYGPPMMVAAELLRPTFIARKGEVLARGDSKQIEARVLPWLAGAEWKLDAFRRFDRGEGPDLYKIGAAGIYHVPPETIGDEDPRRQIGKVSELALGFAGGPGALQAMAKAYGVKIPKYDAPPNTPYDQREPPPDGSDEWIKLMWRAANPEAVKFWRDIDDAAVACMQAAPGRDFPVGKTGRVSFRRNARVLRMRLPSGRPLFYWNPRLIEQRTPWGKVNQVVRFWSEDAQTKRWVPFVAYGGLWTENAVQATARDLMAHWLLEMESAGLPPVLSVHDEGVVETGRPGAAALVDAIMRQKPAWAGDLPVSSDSSAGPRYLK